jgi:ankyrin repeat protein
LRRHRENRTAWAVVEDIPTAASPLAMAAIRGDLAEIKALLEAGAEVNVTDALGRTPLHMAAFYGRTKASELPARAAVRRSTPGTAWA